MLSYDFLGGACLLMVVVLFLLALLYRGGR